MPLWRNANLHLQAGRGTNSQSAMNHRGSTKVLDWEKLGHDYVQEDLILFKTRFDRMKNPSSGRIFKRLVLESVDWVNMVALTPEGQSVMVRQYRFGVGYSTLETPGGMVDPGEDSLTAAKRELLEETGYASDTWRYLGAVEPNPAIHNHLCHHWLAENAILVQPPEPGAGEVIEMVTLSEADIRSVVASGELRHALPLSVLARVFDLWPRPFVHQDGNIEA
ncbi:NUDIX hydrolase [Candidatus Entotheonella serta]|nr:NUDIX hydrolase [Candidatus Entotheonella serta]